MAGGTPIRELVIKVSVDADTSGFGKLDDAQEKSTVGSNALGVALGSLAADLAKAGLEALKTGAALAVDLVFGTAEAADGIAKTAKQLGITTKGLQRLRGAAALTGGDASTLDKGVRILTKGLADAASKGTGPAAEALEALGLEVADIDSLLAEGDIEGAVGVIGDAFNATGESAQKSAALMQLFGGAGTKLRPLIEEGTEGVLALGDAISATGSVIDDEALGQFEDMVDSTFLLDKQFEGLKNQVAGALAPAVTQIASATQAWVAENDQFISQDLPAFLSEVGTALIDTAEAGFEWIDTARELARDTEDFLEIAVELGSELREDAAPAIELVTDGFEFMSAPIVIAAEAVTDLTGAIGGMVLEFADAIGVADELNAALETLRETFGEDEEQTDVRGGAEFAGGGAAIVNPADAKAAAASGDTTRLRKIAASDQFTTTDRAKATAQADAIDTRETTKADKAAAAARAERQASIDASRARTTAARPRRRGGGGGGGAKAPASVAEGPSVDDLISTALGSATGQPGKVASGNALAGTLLVNVDQSVTITNGPLTVDFSLDSLPAGSTVQDFGEEIEIRMNNVINQRNKVTNDFLEARLNVGGG